MFHSQIQYNYAVYAQIGSDPKRHEGCISIFLQYLPDNLCRYNHLKVKKKLMQPVNSLIMRRIFFVDQAYLISTSFISPSYIPATSSLHLQLVLVFSFLSFLLKRRYHHSHTQTKQTRQLAVSFHPFSFTFCISKLFLPSFRFYLESKNLSSFFRSDFDLV